MGRTRLVGTAAIVGLTLAAAACGGGGDGRSADAGTRATDPVTAPGSAEAPAPPAVPDAFRFSAPALAGGRVDGTDYASTGVALWFWAPW